MYLEYFKYIMKHKINVFKCCVSKAKRKIEVQEYDSALMLFIHAFTHDMSKFRLSEFIPYAKWFYGKYGVKYDTANVEKIKDLISDLEIRDKYEKEFNEAWKKHYSRNKHHWNYWENKTMPYRYILQMICDWEAMGMNFGNSAAVFYIDNCEKIKLASDSKIILEHELGLL